MSILSILSKSGAHGCMALKKAIDAPTLITVFKRRIKDAGQKIFVTLDKLRVHRAHAVRAWIDAHPDVIAVFYLPPYAPHLHLHEYLKGDLKLAVANRAPVRDRAGLLRTTMPRLRSLQTSSLPRPTHLRASPPPLRCTMTSLYWPA